MSGSKIVGLKLKAIRTAKMCKVLFVTFGNRLIIRLASSMCVEVGMRKHTCKPVSPTAPRFDRRQQHSRNISGSQTRVC